MASALRGGPPHGSGRPPGPHIRHPDCRKLV